MALPTDGQTNWGDPLNAFVNALQTEANSTQTSLTSHAANSPADPHGDRAYAQGLVTPITSGTNAPNGYVKLNNSGRIIASQITGSGGPGGAYTGIFDAVATYGMTTGNADSSTALQSACTAAAAAGGGIVWIGPGSYSLGKTIFIPSGVWILMSDSTVLNRIVSGTAPVYMFTNIKFDGATSPSSLIRITGGRLDATNGGALTSACTPILIIQSTRTLIENTVVFNVFNNPAIELNGCTQARVTGSRFGGTNKSSGPSPTTPAVRLNVTMASTTPAGLLNTLYGTANACTNIRVSDCFVDNLNSNIGPYAGIVGSDLVGASQTFHNDLTFTGLSIDYAYANVFSVWSNAVWNNAVASAINGPEFNASTRDGWNNMALSSGWTNSGSGPNAQWRYVPSTAIANTTTPVTNTIEIIGDLTIGTSSDSTTFATMGSAQVVSSPQVVDILMPNGSPTVNSRLFYSGNTLKCFGLSGQTGNRLTFHAFISLYA